MWKSTTATRKIRGLDGRLKAVFGGASASKTYSILPILIDRAIKNKNEVITVVSDTARNLRDGAQRDFINIMRDLGRWDRSKWRATDNKYIFGNGTIIEFLGADEPDKFRGPRRDRLYVNEANRIAFDTFVQMDTRTRKEVFLDWNPTAPFWYEEQIKGKVEHSALRLTYLDNEALSEQELEQFNYRKKLAEEGDEYMQNWWRVYGLGLTGSIEGSCIKSFKICKGIMEGYQLIGIGLDFGNVDPNAAVCLYKNDQDHYIFDEILYQGELHISDISNALKEYDANIYADYSWPQTILELKKIGHHIYKCKKGPDSIKHGIDLLNSKVIHVTESSKNLIHEFRTYRYKVDKNGDQVDGKYEGPDHLVDACRYVLTKTLKKRQVKVY